MKTYKILSFLLLVNYYTIAQVNTEYDQFKSGYIPYSNNGKQGLLNKNHNVLINAIYDKITDISFGLIQVEKNSKIGFTDTLGVIKIPLIYDADTNNIIGLSILHQLIFDKNNNVSQENFIASVDGDYINFREGLCAVIKNGKYGFIDTLNNVIIPFIYDGADNFFNNYAIVKKKDKFGVIDNLGKTIIPYTYDSLIWDRGEHIISANSKGVSSNLKL